MKIFLKAFVAAFAVGFFPAVTLYVLAKNKA